MENPILFCKDLQFSYGIKTTFNFSLSLRRNDFCVIVGKSGAGKSTLFSLIAGFLKPQGGKLEINGRCVINKPPVDRDCSILFQSHNLFPHLTVFQNVALALSCKLRLTKEEKEEVWAMLEEFEISDIGSNLAGEISGGQMQRAALARCILKKKPLLLLDEPFSPLDPHLRIKGYEVLYEKALQMGVTVLFVTHFPNEVAHFADCFIQVEGGSNYMIPKEEMSQNFEYASHIFTK